MEVNKTVGGDLVEPRDEGTEEGGKEGVRGFRVHGRARKSIPIAIGKAARRQVTGDYERKRGG